MAVATRHRQLIREAVALSVLACGLSSACGRLREDPLPPLASNSEADAVRRGAAAPDPDGLREAIVRAYAESLPRVDVMERPAPRELCLSVEPQAAPPPTVMAPPPPPPVPFDHHDPEPGLLARLAGSPVRVVPGSSCADPIAAMNIGPILRWSVDAPEFEVMAVVLLVPVGHVRTYSATHSRDGWRITSCRTFDGSCGGDDESCLPREAGIDPYWRAMICKVLDAAPESRWRGDPAYRFTHIPAFHPARVAVVFLEAGTPTVIGTVLGGRGRGQMVSLPRTTRRSLAPEEWQLFQQRLENAGMWEDTDRDDREGLDGARWVLEGWHEGRYKLHNVWSPDDKSFPQYRKACVLMLELAGIAPPPDQLY